MVSGQGVRFCMKSLNENLLVNVHGKPHTGGALSGQQAESDLLEHGEVYHWTVEN